MNKNFRIIDSNISGNPAYNMAADEALFINYIRNPEILPSLRFFTWKPATVSIGYFQKIEEVDSEYCSQQGLGLVRRPTGGRSVLHDNELTYSVIGGREDCFESGNLIEIYKVISESLVTGLKHTGFEVEFKKPDLEKKSEYQSKVLCFDSISQYEITMNGKKVVGSAQVRKRKCFLQHGSIILKMNKTQTARTMKLRSEKFLRNASGLLDEVSLENFSLDILKRNIVKGFEKVTGLNSVNSKLSNEELELVEYLTEEKYSNANWNVLGKDLEDEKVRL